MNTEEKKESKQRKNTKKQNNKISKEDIIVKIPNISYTSKYNLDLSLMDIAVDKAIESGYITKEEFDNGETVINISVVKIGTALDPIEDCKESLLSKFLKFFSKRK